MCDIGSVPLGKHDIDLSTDHETQLLVQTDGVLVRFEHVQKRFVAAGTNRLRRLQCEFGRESFSPGVGMRADRADLDIARYAKALPSIATRRPSRRTPTKRPSSGVRSWKGPGSVRSARANISE